MKRFFVLLAALAPGILMSVSTAQTFSNDPRQEVVLMAYYALRQSHDGGCNQTVPDNGNPNIQDCVSSWNFLNDPNQPSGSFSTVLGWYNQLSGYTQTSRTCLASDWMTNTEYQTWHSSNPNDTCVQKFTPSLYSDVADYGYSTAGGNYGSIGRGGQCRFFANLIYYRSLASLGTPPTSAFSNMWNSVQTNLLQAKPGDILITDPAQQSTIVHTAVVISVSTDGSGHAVLTVIDSNWLTDITGTHDREIIGMHTINAGNWPTNPWGIWTDSSYYSDPWSGLPPNPPTGLAATVQ